MINFQSLIASKASRIVTSAKGKSIIEFGSRRAHGPQAAFLAARAGYIGGCVGTSNALEDYVVTYPWHGWKYSVIDGKAPYERGDSVRSYGIKVIECCIYLINSTSSK